MNRRDGRNQPQPCPEHGGPANFAVAQSHPEARNPDTFDVRQFILSSPNPPAVCGWQLLEGLEDVLSPEQKNQFLRQHRFPPVWGREMEAEIQGRLERAGFSRVRCKCLDQHPVIEIKMRKAANRQLSERQLRRVLRLLAKDLDQTIAGVIVASVEGQRVEAAVVMENPDLITDSNAY